MKIRSGFVSNSSSSSFLIRGIRVKKDELAKMFNVESWDEIPYDKTKDISIQDTRNYFDGEETDDCVVGVDLGGLEDGCVIEIPSSDDVQIMGALRGAGIPVREQQQLSTFVQYISNDNY